MPPCQPTRSSLPTSPSLPSLLLALLQPFSSLASLLAEPQLFQLFQTSIFPNTSSAEIAGRAVLGDVQIFSLDPATWNLDLSYPWVRQAIAEGDAEKIESHYKIYMRNLVRYVRDVGRQAGLACEYRLFPAPPQGSRDLFSCQGVSQSSPKCPAPAPHFPPRGCAAALACPHPCSRGPLHSRFPAADPLVIQIRAGCELSPNGTTRGFFDVAENGASLVAYEVGLHPQLPVVPLCGAAPAHLLLVCRVTGFYPRPIRVDWLRDGQEVPPGPELNSTLTLPNADLTYQLRSVLAVTSHDGHSYACRVQHSSLGGRSLLVPWGRSAAVNTTRALRLLSCLLSPWLL
uniref:Ig-like domain-containing protein n=1 Tax=Apteryx owenii TaxID=8824 RepID=A0A8B9P296_APTOW